MSYSGIVLAALVLLVMWTSPLFAREAKFVTTVYRHEIIASADTQIPPNLPKTWDEAWGILLEFFRSIPHDEILTVVLWDMLGATIGGYDIESNRIELNPRYSKLAQVVQIQLYYLLDEYRDTVVPTLADFLVSWRFHYGNYVLKYFPLERHEEGLNTFNVGFTWTSDIPISDNAAQTIDTLVQTIETVLTLAISEKKRVPVQVVSSKLLRELRQSKMEKASVAVYEPNVNSVYLSATNVEQMNGQAEQLEVTRALLSFLIHEDIEAFTSGVARFLVLRFLNSPLASED